MPFIDQTLPEIEAVQSENKARKKQKESTTIVAVSSYCELRSTAELSGEASTLMDMEISCMKRNMATIRHTKLCFNKLFRHFISVDKALLIRISV